MRLIMDDISKAEDTNWDIGKQRADIIKPLAEISICPRKKILEAANTLKLSERYIYKLIRNYRESHGILTSLIPQRPNGGKGKPRLFQNQESLIEQVIDKLYLNNQKLKPARIIEEIRKQSFEQNIITPSEATIRRRICKIPLVKLQKREEDSTSLLPIVGNFPKVDYPLSVVQIDHTLVDIILVDPIDRLPIGRPYLTIAIDVYSRCIAGFILSLEAPSATSVGLCLTHIAMDKEPWLAINNIDASWSIHGKPNIIYVDNGSDFHSAALTRGCLQHGIQIEYRPLGKAHYGGIIERVIGTLMQLIHTLPGTTFSNVTERGTYPSDTKACLTLQELERWLTISITKYYHVRLHKGTNETPMQRYKNGLELMRQNKQTLYRPQNGKAFLIDFLPISYRKLRRDGFMLDHITYYSNTLRPLIAERERYGKFLIRRDPRDLSRIYVDLPDQQGYLEVSYRILSHPAISLFEHRIALKRLKDAGKQHVQESVLFKAIDEARSIVKTAASTTRSVRRNRTRIQENKKAQPKAVSRSVAAENQDNSIESFTDIEIWK
jgi:putative transposase